MTRYPQYGMVCWPHCRSGLVRKMSTPSWIRYPDRSDSLYRLSYPGPTLSEDMWSNALFIRISCGIFPNPQHKDALPLRFNVNDHEIELWRFHHYTCTYCKQSVLSLLFENERWRGLMLKQSVNTPGTYIRTVALQFRPCWVRSHPYETRINRGSQIPGDMVQVAMANNWFESGS
jgi:hypothetical protein